MTRMFQLLCGAAFATALVLSAARAANADAILAKQSIAVAVELQAHAMNLDDGWSTTEAALQQAQAAYAKHDYAMALAQAQHAQKLAHISIAQAESQKKFWRNEVAN